MELKAVSGAEVCSYAPQWMDQRKIASRKGMAEAVWAEIKPMNRGEMKRYQQMVRFNPATDGRGIGTNRGEVDRRIFVEHIVTVHNLRIGGREIRTGADLYDADDAPPEIEDLIAELGKALGSLSMLSEGEIKN